MLNPNVSLRVPPAEHWHVSYASLLRGAAISSYCMFHCRLGQHNFSQWGSQLHLQINLPARF